MTKLIRMVGWTLAALAGLVLAAILALSLLDWNLFRDQVEGIASGMLGRDVRIGRLDVDIGWTTDVRIRELTVANADWADGDPLLELPEARLRVAVMPLLRGEIRLKDIVLDRPDIALQRDTAGRVNWEFGDAEDQQDDEGGAWPVIDRVQIRQGALSYRDSQRDLDIAGSIATRAAQSGDGDRLHVDLAGELQRRPLELAVTAGSLLALRDTGQPYPLSVDVGYGKTRLKAEGTVQEPLNLRGFEMALATEGPTLARLFPLLGIPLPDSPPYDLDGNLALRDGVWLFRDFAGAVGDSNLSGDLSLDPVGDVPFLEADLVSTRLDLDDLAGLVGAAPDPDETANSQQQAEAGDGRFFPDEPIAADRLHAMDMDVTFNGTDVITPLLPIDSLSFRVRVDDGRAEANPLRIDVAGGSIHGEMALNARQSVPSADADLRFEDINIKPFFADTQFVQETGGLFTGRAYVLGVGHSLAEMMASLRGELKIAMRQGSVSALLVEAVGLDVIEALGLVFDDDVRIPLRCARLDLAVEEGVADITRLLIDTSDSLLVADGEIDLGRERFDVHIEARAKDFSLIDLTAPVRVQGGFSDFDYEIAGNPLPFFEMGEQENLDCQALVKGVR